MHDVADGLDFIHTQQYMSELLGRCLIEADCQQAARDAINTVTPCHRLIGNLPSQCQIASWRLSQPAHGR